MAKKKVGIVGYGNMGSAIAEGIKGDYTVLVFDKDTGKTAPAKEMKTARSLEELLAGADIVVLAVKPQELGEVLERVKDGVGGKLVVSIAAGIPTSLFEERLGGGCRVVRAMPNLPAKVGKGMICFCAGKNAGEDDLGDAAGIFSFIGRVMRVDESLRDAGTAGAGSGPGYLYFLLEQARKEEWISIASGRFTAELSSAAESVGFSPQDAAFLASVTAEGSMALLASSGVSPEVLRAQVTSRGGTTEAGINAMKSSGNSLKEAVKAALKRARELSTAP